MELETSLVLEEFKVMNLKESSSRLLDATENCAKAAETVDANVWAKKAQLLNC